MCTGHWLIPIGIMTSAPCFDEPLGFIDEVLDGLVVVRRQVRQIETRDTKIDDMMFHAITAHDTAQKRHLALVVNNQAEPVADERRDMQRRFRRTDDGNVHGRLASVNSQFQGAKGNNGIVAFFLRAFEAFYERRRHQLYFRRCHPIEIGTGRHVDNPDLDFLSRVRQRNVSASFMFLGRIAADDKRNSNHLAILLNVLVPEH